MKKIAMILNGVVVNVSIWDGIVVWNPGNQYVLVDVTNLDPQPAIDWLYDGSNFSPPTDQ